ncbi:hypothetical protein BGZ76_004563 [Entomortierella beljakovae]|nr:hypothetical protein BGZ76_004563 [Entomortierella beljakovae]
MHWNTRQYSGYSHDNRYIDSERKERSASAGELKYQTQVPIPHSVPELNCSEPESLRYDDNGHVVRGHIIEISMDEPIHTNGTSNGPPIAADYSYLQHKLPDTPPAVSLGLPSHPRTKWEYNPSPVTQCVDRLPRHNSSTYTGDNSSPQTPSDRGITSPSFVGSPMIPSCYAFDPNQQKYLPAFVNVAARAEQGHKATRELVKRCLSQPSQSHSQVVKTRNKSGQSPQLNALSLSPFHFEGPLESEGSESYFPSTKPTKDPLKLHCDINDIVIDTSSNIDNNISVENNLQAISPKSIYRGDF